MVYTTLINGIRSMRSIMHPVLEYLKFTMKSHRNFIYCCIALSLLVHGSCTGLTPEHLDPLHVGVVAHSAETDHFQQGEWHSPEGLHSPDGPLTWILLFHPLLLISVFHFLYTRVAFLT